MGSLGSFCKSTRMQTGRGSGDGTWGASDHFASPPACKQVEVVATESGESHTWGAIYPLDIFATFISCAFTCAKAIGCREILGNHKILRRFTLHACFFKGLGVHERAKTSQGHSPRPSASLLHGQALFCFSRMEGRCF